MTDIVQPLDLPPGWCRTTLGQVISVIRGVSYKKQDAGYEARAGVVPILRATNIRGRIAFEDLVYVPDHYVKREQYLIPGDIVIAASSGSRSVVGKAAQLSTDWVGSFGAFCLALRPYYSFTNGYLSWFLQSQEYRNRVSELAAGVNINNLRREHIEDTPVSIPPLPEQHRIVAEIEKQFTRLDASVAALRRTQANLKRYRASTLRAACSGELVPTEAELARAEGREYEPARVLLERILTERRARWESQEKRRGKYKEPAAPDTSGLPPLPEGWAWGSIDNLVGPDGVFSDGDWVESKDQDPNGDVRLIQLADVGNGTYLNKSSRFLTSQKSRDLRCTYLEIGDVLIARMPEPLGRACIFPGDTLTSVTVVDVCIVRTGTVGPDHRWLSCFVNAPDFRRRVSALQSGSTRKRISRRNLASIPIALPPLAEQLRIVAEVERRLSVILQAEAAVDASLQRAERLRQSILKRAFSGQLVPQDPDDEPASVLLERIRAQREAEQAAATASKKRPARRRQASSQS